jgi:hypothetical protein
MGARGWSGGVKVGPESHSLSKAESRSPLNFEEDIALVQIRLETTRYIWIVSNVNFGRADIIKGTSHSSSDVYL